jgi:hypothetical protein
MMEAIEAKTLTPLVFHSVYHEYDKYNPKFPFTEPILWDVGRSAHRQIGARHLTGGPPNLILGEPYLPLYQ